MSLRQPPVLAAWFLDRLGYTRENAALTGDLLEELQSGRSRAWYWRQTAMVIANGVGRNAVALQSYLNAVLVGFAVQAPIVFALWRLQSPPPVHGPVRAILAAALVLAGHVLVALAKAWVTGQPSADLKLLAGGSEDRRSILALVVFDTVTFYVLSYCIFALFLAPLSLVELASVELSWLVLWQLTPALVRARRA